MLHAAVIVSYVLTYNILWGSTVILVLQKRILKHREVN